MDRQWMSEGVQVFEEGEEEYCIEGMQLTEDQPTDGGDPDPPTLVRKSLMLTGVGR